MEINLYEWHRFRIVNTNMAYLIWQLNAGDNTLGSAYVQPNECQVWLLGNDGINFEDGPRFVYNPPYNGSIVLPPGGRADVMVICFKNNIYNVIANKDSRNISFYNAPLPTQNLVVMHIIVDDSTTVVPDYIPCSNNITAVNCTCEDWNTTALPCMPLPYEYSPYLTKTNNLTYPDVTSECATEQDPDDMKLCYVMLC